MFEAFCTCLLALQHFITLFIAVLSMYFLIYFLNFLTLVSSVICLCTHPSSRFSHVCRLSLFSPSFSAFLSLSLLCWSLWLILKGNRESEWDLKEREALCSTQQGRPSLDWNTARKRGKKNTTHTHNTGKRRAFSLSLIFSFLHLSTLLSHHSWVVWYLTFTLLQQGLRSELRERKLVSPLSYSVIPLRLFPLPLSFLLSLLPFLPVSISVMFSALQSSNGRKKKVEIPRPTPTFLPIMYSVRLLHRLLSLMRTVLLLFL